MNPWVRETLRWTLVVTLLVQPVLSVWLVILALRIRRDQARIQRFVDIWATRLMTTTTLPTDPEP